MFVVNFFTTTIFRCCLQRSLVEGSICPIVIEGNTCNRTTLGIDPIFPLLSAWYLKCWRMLVWMLVWMLENISRWYNYVLLPFYIVMLPLYLGGLVCILIWCECLIFEKVSLHFHRVSLSNTEPTLQGFRGLKQHGDFRSFVLQFQVVRSEGHFRKRKIDSNLFFHRFHFFLSRKSSFVWCDCPSRNLYSVGEDLVLCRRCFLCEHFHSIQHAGWCCAWVSWDYITKVFVQYLLWLLFEILCLQWLRTRYNVRVCEEKNLSSWEPMRLTRSMRRTMSQEWALRTKNAVQRDTFPGLHQQTFEVIVRTVLSIRSVLDSVRIYECWCLSWVCVRECSLDVFRKSFISSMEHNVQHRTRLPERSTRLGTSRVPNSVEEY